MYPGRVCYLRAGTQVLQNSNTIAKIFEMIGSFLQNKHDIIVKSRIQQNDQANHQYFSEIESLFCLFVDLSLSWPYLKIMERIMSSIKMCIAYLLTLNSGIPLSEFKPRPPTSPGGFPWCYWQAYCRHMTLKSIINWWGVSIKQHYYNEKKLGYTGLWVSTN